MIGLLRKDLYIISHSYKKNLLFILVLYTILAVLLQMTVFAYIVSWIAGFYIVGTLSIDNYCKWDLYMACSPVKKSAAVASKFVLTALAMAAAMIYNIVLCFILSLTGLDISVGESLICSLLVSSLALCYFGFTLCLSYKLGCEKARTAMMTIMIVLIGCLLLLGFSQSKAASGIASSGFVRTLDQHPLPFLFGTIAVCVILYLLSFLLAVKLYSKKEF